MKKILFALLLFYACAPAAPKQDERPLVFVGTYTQKLGHVDGKATGIYVCRFDAETGALTVVDSATDIVNPSFLCLSPDKKHLYAVAETGGSPEQPFGKVAAYQVGDNGKLQKINEVSTYGVAPCFVSTNREGTFAFVANYATGNVTSYGIQPNGGLTDSLSMKKHPGETPWAHMIIETPDNDNIWAVDKGADQVFMYHLNKEGKLGKSGNIPVAKGSGPRHLDFNPKAPQQFALINELGNTVNYYMMDPESGVTILMDSLSTLPAGFSGVSYGADLHFHPNGQFLYGSNRGDNSIVIYAVDIVKAKLRLVGHQSTEGAFPRNFLITPDGKWLLAANQNSGNVSSFKIDAATGLLTPAGKPSLVATPVCLKMK